MFYNIFFRFLVLFSFIMIILKADAQNREVQNAIIIDPNIHTLNVYSRNDINAFPIIELNSKQKIQINFDYFEEDSQDLVYQIIHCDADWNNSNLSEFKYIEGFNQNYITNYNLSFNSNINYTNYSLDIPNDDIQLTKSGNYKLLAYKTEDQIDTLFVAKFYIIESLAKIKGRVRSTSNPKLIDTSQEVDFTVDHSNVKVFNQSTDLRTFLWQNEDQSNRRELKPLFIRGNVCSFDYNEENVFPAGNEFRQFNTSSTKYIGRFIKSVSEENNYTYFSLRPSYNRHFKRYVYERDDNGNYVINAENKNDPNTEADYVYVNFTLAMDTPLDKDIYVYGKLSNWGIREQFKMKYNLKLRAYTLSLLLKQGYYNYEYVTFDKETIDRTFIEGSHNQTENNYSIAVYLKDYANSYDRLIGYKELNSTLHQAIDINN